VAKLANRVQNALDEGRILVIGMQILLGFQYRAFFEPGFERLPAWAQATKLTGLCVMLVSLALVILPGPFHRLVEGGEDTERVHRVASLTASLALGPFAAALGMDVLAAMARVEDAALRATLAVGGATTGVALAFWYAFPMICHRRRAQEDDVQRSDLDKKIRHVLTEARMVLPGVQAMLGFQLAVTLMDAFDELPRAWQLVHAGAMLVTALAVVLLMAPAAYHRIAEEGDETERFHRVASRFVVAALIPLAVSMGAELAVVTYRLTRSAGVAVALGAAAVAALLAAWLGFPLAVRALDHARRREAARA
jgi:hypothetical protein